jgi:hypothetical protein
MKGSIMKKFRLTLSGTAPMLMHNAQLSDEFNPVVLEMKKITAKKTKKTEDDRWELRRLEFVGSLYYDQDAGPYVPAANIEASLAKAAGLTRNGQDVKRGVRIVTDVNPLGYRGPRNPDDLWKESSFVHNASVKVGTARIIRTRPIFRDWITEVEGVFDPTVVDFESLKMFAEKAGQLIGLGDWRPRFGTFDAEIEELS